MAEGVVRALWDGRSVCSAREGGGRALPSYGCGVQVSRDAPPPLPGGYETRDTRARQRR